MPVYEYKGYNKRGKLKKGIIDAPGKSAAKNKLRSEGIYIIDLNPLTSAATHYSKPSSGEIIKKITFVLPFRSRLGELDLALFFRQLATLLSAGLPLIKALHLVLKQIKTPSLKKVLIQVKERVNEGASLFAALEEHSSIFDQSITSMIRAGENSGTLELVLERLADMTEQRLALKRKVQSALAYPILLLCAGIGVIFFLMGYIVPRITKIFFDFKQALPLPTIILIYVSHVFQHYWWVMLALICLCFTLLYKFSTTAKGRKVVDRVKLKIILVGPLYFKIAIARFARTLGTLLNNHVPLTTSLEIVRGVINNQIFSEAIDLIQQKIIQGENMADALQESQIFPPDVVQMVAAGEQSDRVGDMLLKIAQTYENEISSRLTILTSLLEPIMILILGGLVGFVVLAVLLPIFEMSHLVK